MSKKHIGCSFEDLLKEEGTYEEITTQAVKRVLAWQVSEVMKQKGISKMEMARRMRTSRSQLDRFLDPDKRQGAVRDCTARCLGNRQARFPQSGGR